MQLHQLVANKNRQESKRIGRGGKRGKTSGRGGKGQTARAGNSTRPEMRDIIKKLPKLRGHGVNRARTVNAERVLAVPVNLNRLEAVFAKGDVVSPKTLVSAGVVTAVRKKAPLVKILATGEITKAIKVEGCTVSAAAKVKIEAAGGSVTGAV
jgi:large subunit ribosomal protein L15